MIKQTPFYSKHIEAGANMVDFFGFSLPIYAINIAEKKRDLLKSTDECPRDPSANGCAGMQGEEGTWPVVAVAAANKASRSNFCFLVWFLKNITTILI